VLIQHPELAKEIIRATKRGAEGLPVSVKTRIGYKQNEIATWIPALLEENLAALTVHLRTQSEMSDVPAHWDLVPEILAFRDRIAPETILLGNGDIDSLDQARTCTKESGMDGVMVGRGMFGNPWFFSGRIPDLRERLARMVQHTELFEKLYKSNLSKKEGKLKNFDVMKKHFKAYVTGFDGSKELRVRLMDAKNADEVRNIIEEFLKTA
jgi:tRNA-dihydrouridine synthase